MEAYAHWQKNNFVETGEKALPGREMCLQLVSPDWKRATEFCTESSEEASLPSVAHTF
jgi:hypothetical protein